MTTLHKEMRIELPLPGRNYAAFGFLDEGEESVDASTMFARTGGKNRVIAGDKDWELIKAHLRWINPTLKDFHLVTKRDADGSPRSNWGGGHSWDEWYGIGDKWNADGLVICCVE
ncbi:MAG: hypothetical protein A2821_04275 [Candidatus Magasanikbacteria bacterium RIFCSPHIGHO2_01_FULL_41_23]|uniref:Uncharacterized protein n=1 Tax=Candidatus Magasanikbacteria bacterium RIFCSPLOWO2_01_FULL_40_15 TaxID=1798686 RepID=A0A1F6N427_9BACT|nr:MAG: hypothetical protein A2821_04275 [Candidatus Magasanikbacteria bacterium RIFCSPHIGHO2_01_FULL_41_23]OGH67143.1 MAG: hypothetical protein A3C66_02590 [Candidatus Magasanikbacteria bacterium RIFCSPHIGHO2_02_FULL_41_35]OGH76731.1 MAG: hypothetical protein A3F22_03450 [Candidatus Magasanikbacteria bacterium RIFCSPHIGHO2_12_FULL_41_16]OGH78679.1 MAG: hypothetical protein A2983_04225 [Candidatus Magasanikbacteria bacterium RIFCSPLOWO2_01_FULL_40_15]